MKTDKTRPVSSFKHDEKRAAIPDSAHRGRGADGHQRTARAERI